MYLYAGLALLGVSIFTLSYSQNEKFLDWLRFQSLGTRDYIVEKLSLMFIDIPPHYILGAQFAFSLGLGSIVFLAFLPKVLIGVVFGLIVTGIGWKAPKPIVNWLYNRRVNKFTLQMVDGLGLMANGMKSGLSVVQAMALVTQEMQNPIKQEFELVLNENKLGVSLEDAFVNLSKRVEGDDVEMFVTSVVILKETGGNLAETFDTIVQTIRDRIKVENKIKALTAQGLYQGFALLCVPPGLGIYLASTDPKFMSPLWETTIGWFVILLVVGLELFAFFLIMKITKIDV